MIISSRGRYALQFMLDLAEQAPDHFVTLKDVVVRQELSKKYMEQILPALSASHLLITKSGHHGGYRLAKEPEAYTLGEILRASEGSLSPVACTREDSAYACGPCHQQATCVTLPVWTELDRLINNYLDSVTLQDLLDQKTCS